MICRNVDNKTSKPKHDCMGSVLIVYYSGVTCDALPHYVKNKSLLELKEGEEKEVEPDDFRFVLDRLVHWIKEEYKCVEVDRTE